jgi:uroporphyrinogen decarboxylase
MGGLPNRHGVLADGPKEAVRQEVHKVISEFGRTGFILGADCTLATEQNMELLKAAVDAARE